MNFYFLPLLLLATISYSQPIEVYYPEAEIDPYDVDPYGGSYGSDPLTVRGIVSGASSGGTRGEDYDKQHITLKAWQAEDTSSINDTNLLVFRTVESGRDFFQDIAPYSIVEFQLFINETGTRAVLVAGRFITEPTPELLVAQTTIMDAAFLHSEQFGEFTFNPEVEWFERQLTWLGDTITVAINIEDSSQLTDHLRTLEELFANQQYWQQQVDAYAIQELLPLKNDYWLDPGEAPWEAERFVNTYQLEAIWIFADGTFQFWHTDGDIFGGHYIVVTGNLETGPDDADIPG